MQLIAKFGASLLVLCGLCFGQVVPSTFFGLQSKPTGGTYPTINFGSYRLWDDPVSWKAINTGSGTFVYNTTIDPILNSLFTHGITDEVIYTFGVTPNWISSVPGDTACDFGESGGCDPPSDLAADGTGTNATFKAFVTSIATHANDATYLTTHAHIKYWEPWNEWYANPTVNSSFGVGCAGRGGCSFTATYAQMVRMTEDLRCIVTGTGSINGVACALTAIDPTAKILSPSGDGHNSFGWAVQENFLHCDHSPKSGSNCTTVNRGYNAIDILNFHFYADGTSPSNPQNVITEAAGIKGVISSGDITAKGLWSDEGGWGVQSALTDVDLREAFVSTYYLLGWSNGLGRMVWYEYENAGWGTLCSPQTSCVLNGAGIAYNQAYLFMVGANLTSSCSVVSTIWSCPFTKAGVSYLVMWDSSKTCSVGSCTTANQTVANNWLTYKDMTAAVSPINIVSHIIPLGIKPLVLTSVSQSPASLQLVRNGALMKKGVILK